MDYLRSCYSSTMRLFIDGAEVLVHGRWHFCPEGAEDIPYMHRFAASTWDPDNADLDESIGEIRGVRGYFNGSSSPRILGQGWCGSQGLWENGSPLSLRGTMPVDTEGIPLCCLTGPLSELELNAGGAGGAALVAPVELRAGGTGGAYMTAYLMLDSATVTAEVEAAETATHSTSDTAIVVALADDDGPDSDSATVVALADDDGPTPDTAIVTGEAADDL